MKSLTRLGILTFLTIFISGCSTFNKTIDSVGGLFSGKNNDTSLIDNDQTAEIWHCYGSKEKKDWQCQTEADPGKITAVGSKTVIATTTEVKARETRLLQTSQNQSPQNQSSQNQSPQNQSSQIQENTSAPTTTSKADLPVQTTESVPPQADPVSSPIVAKIPETIDFLLKQPAGHYAVQLIALPNEEEIVNYAGRNGIIEPVFAKIQSQGQAWYVLLLGIFENKSAAEKAKNEWETSKVLRVKPWVRQLGPLQEAIKSAMHAD